ncbi:MAG TPA: transaldolase [Terriglobales bacterium]|nr:transaldolase [Terriglobales bacterium]
MFSRAQQLRSLGQSVWLDYIHRRELRSGVFLAQVRDQGVSGVTSNPTIFEQAIGKGQDYDASIEQHIARGLKGPALFEALAVEDVQSACDLLKPVYDGTDGLDGRVSIEVSPGRAHDAPGTIDEARRLHREVARPNVMVKVPATAEGLPAVTTLTAEGVCVNVTLIFSLERYGQVMDAFLAGLERRAAANQPLHPIVSVASFFVSRVDTKVDKAIEQRLQALPAGSPERAELERSRGKAAVANAQLAYARFGEVFGSSRFAKLRDKGARVQRPLWASTSTKNPAYPDTIYVDELIGPDTVNTMPPQTLAAYNEHGRLEVTITRGLDDARALFRGLPQRGVPIDELIAQLEEEGVKSFAKSYDTLIATLEEKRAQMSGKGR